MAGIALLMLLTIVVVLPLFAVALVLWLVGIARPPQTPAQVLRAARRHEALVALAATSAGTVTAAALLWLPGSLFTAPPWEWAVAPFVAAMVVAVVRSAGELTWPRPRGPVRVAPLTRRSIRTVGAGRLALLLATASVSVLSLLAFGVTATRDGRGVAEPARPGQTSSAGAYPGWPYGVPMLITLVLTLAVTLAALHLIARRRPLEGLAVGDDDALRRTSSARLLGGVQLGVGGGTALLDLFAGGVLCGAGWRLPGSVALVVGFTVGVATVFAVATCLAPQHPRSAQLLVPPQPMSVA